MRKRWSFLSIETWQRFLDGWGVLHNFLAVPDDVAEFTPGRMAGLQAPLRYWHNAVDCLREVWKLKRRTEGFWWGAPMESFGSV